jgi:outer membrane protein OmpA-like peptidoglycan-associated protein
MKRLTLLIGIIFLSTTCKTQVPLNTTSKKAQKAYESATEYAQMLDYDNAFKQLDIAKKEDPNFAEPYALAADLYMSEYEWSKAIDEFKKSFTINPSLFIGNYFDCGNAELKLGRYDDAKKDFQIYLAKHTSAASPYTIQDAQQGVADCDFAINAMAHPVDFKPLNMGEKINTDGCEYFPNVTGDDQTFLFTRNRQEKNAQGVMTMTQEDFFISYRDANGNWTTAANMGAPINTPENEGAPSLSTDGRFLFFAACEGEYGYGNGRQGYGSCDIFYTQKINGAWTKPTNVGAPVNTQYWDSQPSFSSDGKTLYFISHRPKGEGDSDIWTATLGDDGKWSVPVNMGNKINTPGKEEAVFIHPDNQTLYFASDGWTGMGGLDLYVCHRDSTGNWGPPINLGYPINTFGDESGMIVNGSGQVAYFSSTGRDGGLGCDDIYMFNLPKEFQPVSTTYMKGKTFNKKTLKPVGAQFELIDLATGKTVITSYSDPGNGEFFVTLPVNHDYALNVNATGYCFYSETFQMKESKDPSKPFRMDVPLQPIDTGIGEELKNVFFETGKFDLKPESKAELNKLAKWLKANPKVKIELQGHTDNVGDKKMNMTLSTNRAKAVYDYLITQGIDASRLTYKGYGDTKPKVPNDTPEHRQMNRRTEYMITGVK